MMFHPNSAAIITGAASGIGFSIAKRLAGEHVQLALLDQNIDQLNAVARSLNTAYKTYQVNVTDESQVKSTVDQIVNDFGQIHILINSAGITGKTNIKSHLVDSENLDLVFGINFKGSFLMAKYVLPNMIHHQYGRILHIASIAGKEGNAGMLAYSASKAAVIGMTKVQGKEYAETGITINAIAPAVIQTALVDNMPPEQVRYMTDKIPMRRCGTLEEIADMVAFIVSKENSFTTGFTFDMSGGRAVY